MSESLPVLGLTAAQIDRGGAHWTAGEIAQQPGLWQEIARLIAADAGLTAFLTPQLANRELQVVLSGAGTSSFIGECLAPALTRNALRPTLAIASTDIVADPAASLAPGAPTLLVHFARSGNSPESVGAMELAEQYLEHCTHLIVTCNAEGALHQRARDMRQARVVLLPAASNDQGFAMTSSFTGMLLAAAAALRLLPGDGGRAAALSRLGAHVLTAYVPLLTSLVHAQFERVVYLGSNELKGLAREAALKMLELTDGRVVAVAESPLGFRHGPKTILNGSTLVVAFLSSDAHTRRYDLDLLAELRREAVAGRVVALTGSAAPAPHPDTVTLGAAAPAGLTDLELCLPYIVFAQSLALLRSLSLGVTPDNPNAAGTVSRVVQGVSIYPYERRR